MAGPDGTGRWVEGGPPVSRRLAAGGPHALRRPAEGVPRVLRRPAAGGPLSPAPLRLIDVDDFPFERWIAGPTIPAGLEPFFPGARAGPPFELIRALLVASALPRDRARRLLEAPPRMPEHRVVDLRCGASLALWAAASIGAESVGRDPDPLALRLVAAGLAPVDPALVRAEADRVRARVEAALPARPPPIGALQPDADRSDEDGPAAVARGRIERLHWVMVTPCPACRSSVDLFATRLIGRSDGVHGSRASCPTCGAIVRVGSRSARRSVCSACRAVFDPRRGAVDPGGHQATCPSCQSRFAVDGALRRRGDRPLHRPFAASIRTGRGVRLVAVPRGPFGEPDRPEGPLAPIEPSPATSRLLALGLRSWRELFPPRTREELDLAADALPAERSAARPVLDGLLLAAAEDRALAVGADRPSPRRTFAETSALFGPGGLFARVPRWAEAPRVGAGATPELSGWSEASRWEGRADVVFVVLPPHGEVERGGALALRAPWAERLGWDPEPPAEVTLDDLITRGRAALGPGGVLILFCVLGPEIPLRLARALAAAELSVTAAHPVGGRAGRRSAPTTLVCRPGDADPRPPRSPSAALLEASERFGPLLARRPERCPEPAARGWLWAQLLAAATRGRGPDALEAVLRSAETQIGALARASGAPARGPSPSHHQLNLW